MESLTLSMRGPKASASLVARWPQVHNCQSSHGQTGVGSKVASFSNIHAFGAASRSKITVAIVCMGGHFLILRRDNCIISLPLCCKHLQWWSNFGGSHQPTHFGIRTHTSSLRRLTNGSKLTWTVKVTITRYVDYKRCRRAKLRCFAQWRLLLSDRTSLSSWESLTSTNTSVQSPLLLSFNSNCVNFYTITTEFVMSLFMLQVIQSRTSYAISFHVDQTLLPFPSFCETLCCSTFYPLLKECHSCSANTEPRACLKSIPNPSAHTIAHFSLAHTLAACTVKPCRQGRNTRQVLEHMCTTVQSMCALKKANFV